MADLQNRLLAGPSEDLAYSEATTALILDVSRQWLAKGRRKGFGPPYVRIAKKMIRYRREDLVLWLRGEASA